MKVVLKLTQEAYEKLCVEITTEMLKEEVNKIGEPMLELLTLINVVEFKTRLERKLFNTEEMN